MNHRFLRSMLVLILISLFLVVPQSSTAQEETEYVGLDVVFLIDQSGSMGGKEAGCTICDYANDPQKLRFAAPEFAIKLLGDGLLQGQIVRRVPADVQVGIVSFGSTAEVSLPPTLIRARTENDWNAEWANLAAKLLDIREDLSIRNLQRTDPKLAFKEARRLFTQMAQNTVANSGPRLKAIILLTDGGPCAEGCDPENISSETVKAYLQEMQEEIRGRLGSFPDDEYQILVIGMRDPTDTSFPAGLPILSTITNGNAFEAENEAVAGGHLYRFLNPLLQSLGGNTGEEWLFGVPKNVSPYLRSIVFTVFKSEQGNAPVKIEENGIELTLVGDSKDDRITVTGDNTSPIQTIIVEDPTPGTWVVFKEGDADISVWAYTLDFQVLPTTSSLANSLQFFPVNLSFILRDEHGNLPPIYADTKYALTPQLTIATNNTTETLPVTQTEDDQYRAEFTPITTGTHSAHLRVTTNDVDNSTIVLLDTDIGSFTISPVELSFNKPDGLFYQNKPIVSTFKLVGEQGETIELPDNWKVNVVVSGPDDQPTVDLKESQGEYEITFTPGNGGDYDLSVKITGQDRQARPFTVTDGKEATYLVRPTTTLDFDIIYPAEHTIRKAIGWWAWRMGETGELLPYTITVRLMANSQPIAAESVGEDNTTPFSLTLYAPENEVGQPVDLLPTNQEGTYQAEVKLLDPPGLWQFEVIPQLNLSPDYLMDQQSKKRQLTLLEDPVTMRYQQTWDRWFPIGSGMLATLLALLIIWRLLLMRNACQGTIMVVDEFEAPVATLDLGSKRKNSIIFKRRSLPAAARLKRLEVHRPGKENNVLVTATLADGSKPITSQLMIHETKIPLIDDLYLKYINYAASGTDGGAYAYNV